MAGAGAALLLAAATAYHPLDQTRLDCEQVEAAYGSALGIVSIPGFAVEVTGNATAPIGRKQYDPIIFRVVEDVTVCAGHLYVGGGEPRFCTAGKISAIWYCPDETDSSQCWTQTATGSELLQYHRHHSVTWPHGSSIAVTFDKPDSFSDLQGMLACAALLAVALALRSGVHHKLALNWACALVPLVSTQHALIMQPQWSLALLSAAATSVALQFLFTHPSSIQAERQLKPLIMAGIALSLPHHAIGIHAALLSRLVIGLGISVVTGARPTVDNIVIFLWAAVVLIRPIVIIAGVGLEKDAVVNVKAASISATAFVTGHLARHTLLVS